MKIGLLDNVDYGGCNDFGDYSVLLIDVQFGCGSVVTLLPSLWKHGICQYKVKLNDGDKPCDGARGNEDLLFPRVDIIISKAIPAFLYKFQ